MEMNEIKHSVLMITYNQEHLLPLALDSVFQQSVLPYEVIISDDCSTDGTWNVICEYYNRYPEIIKPLRNEINLGVFGNFNKVKTLPTGDVISCLSGDDLYKPGIFEAFNQEIKNKKCNPQKIKFTIICNAVDLYPDGREVIYNNYKLRNKNLFKQKIRYRLNFRDTGFSACLFQSIDPIRLDLGYHADWIYCIDQLVKCDEFIFVNSPFPVYRIGSGVVSKSKQSELILSRIKTIQEIKKQYAELLDRSDLNMLNFDMLLSEIILKNSLRKTMRFIALFFLNTNEFIKLGLLYTNTKNLIKIFLNCVFGRNI